MTQKIAIRPPHSTPLGKIESQLVLINPLYISFFDEVFIKMNSMIDEIDTLNTQVADLEARVSTLEQA